MGIGHFCTVKYKNRGEGNGLNPHDKAEAKRKPKPLYSGLSIEICTDPRLADINLLRFGLFHFRIFSRMTIN